MTAEELSIKYFGGMHYDDITIEYIQKYAVEFARLKVQEALETAADKAFVVMKEDMDFYYEDYVEGVDKNSILNSYDLKSIV
ncbi:MAG: hypothetical protein WAZ19_02440 [Anaerolineae bacterium]